MTPDEHASGDSPAYPDSHDPAEEEPTAVTEAPAPADPEERILTELHALRRQFEAKIRYDEVKERQIDRMHEELQEHRADLHLKLLRPVFTDLIAIYDDLDEALRGAPAASAKLLESLRKSVVETLRRNGVTHYIVDDEGDVVDRGSQQVVEVVSTTDPTRDRRIASRLRVGFVYGDKVLRPECVAAYRYAPAGNAHPDHGREGVNDDG